MTFAAENVKISKIQMKGMIYLKKGTTKPSTKRASGKRRPLKDSTKQYLVFAAVIALVAVIAIGAYSLRYIYDPNSEYCVTFQQKADQIKGVILQDGDIGQLANERYIVSLSISDSAQKAFIRTASGKTVEEAFDSAAGDAKAAVGRDKYQTAWIRADVGYDITPIARNELNSFLKSEYKYDILYGLAFDKSCKYAAMPEVINVYHMISPKNQTLNLNNINRVLGSGFTSTPKDVSKFSVLSFFLDENDDCFEMGTELSNFGMRKIDKIERDFVKDICVNSTAFLNGMIKTKAPEGEFVYGYYGTTGRQSASYNILRHSGTLWSMTQGYRLDPNPELKEGIGLAAKYLATDAVEHVGDQAYIVERKNDEIKLGANGLAVIALTEYMETFDSDEYKDLTVKLGNTMISQFQRDDGGFNHVFSYPDLELVAETRTTFYDGEAVFALCKLYTLTKDEKYLDAAKKAVDYFIDNDYTQYRDQWLGYTINELTKYVKDEKYFQFAFEQMDVHRDNIASKIYTSNVDFELIMTIFEIYQRAVDEKIDVAYLDNFDFDKFMDALDKRAHFQLRSYLFPEIAMYMSDPSTFVDTFFIRNSNYRMRIDDVQHSIGGYYLYYQNYDAINKALAG